MNSFLEKKPIIGMIHLMPLPGSPSFKKSTRGPLDHIIEFALADAASLVAGGVDAIMIENFGDAPFYSDHVPHETVAAMTVAVKSIRDYLTIPFGINVLRNDGIAALSIAQAVGASFVRINILAGARVTDQGIIGAKAHEILRHRVTIGAGQIKILADVNVKHSQPLGSYDLQGEVKDLTSRAGADAIIVSGRGTGEATSEEDLKQIKAVSKRPVLIGSGLTTAHKSIWDLSDGAIVGTAFKSEGDVAMPVDSERIKEFISAMR